MVDRLPALTVVPASYPFNPQDEIQAKGLGWHERPRGMIAQHTHNCLYTAGCGKLIRMS
jgi:hypothetical protein